MGKCAACGKEVYFAEKKTSLGKEWHGPCLKCVECKKTLTCGAHSEHDGKPYCTTPCHMKLFGPGGYRGAGTSIDSHKYK
ncbi:hypothetical protein CAOG_04145 [Capsaspora owczarzaki ATCC 30864]|uniref:Cysteine-rich protein 1 n=1 Tax=Capsaspora owczarzaki (strain ATCC 30864) TaxID=595528 RepID=A0A0D2WPJ6_CAPO3|nr:hypothetical protein CAOG_04145 [Capsaspora owczarzaki ATCC 30864]KJE93340.1 hypothetical protein CAOG_004145 [Capsaspora owczarzaki ATCC 30864]|eukprot:XP_004347970.2 hypothetical protein CAOG_04145 [Capsaspora owczarzaki ATCC 30864]